jgi:hypothetical protein
MMQGPRPPSDDKVTPNLGNNKAQLQAGKEVLKQYVAAGARTVPNGQPLTALAQVSERVRE